MKIKVKDIPSNYSVGVKRISWKERCEKQLNEIIGELNEIKNNLEKDKKALEQLGECL